MKLFRHAALSIASICVVMLFVRCQPESTPEPAPSPTRSMKGYELYSRQIDDVWYFSLLPGTNRLKTFTEISAPEVQVRGLDALKLVLDQLPSGEQLFWSAGRFKATFVFGSWRP